MQRRARVAARAPAAETATHPAIGEASEAFAKEPPPIVSRAEAIQEVADRPTTLKSEPPPWELPQGSPEERAATSEILRVAIDREYDTRPKHGFPGKKNKDRDSAIGLRQQEIADRLRRDMSDGKEPALASHVRAAVARYKAEGRLPEPFPPPPSASATGVGMSAPGAPPVSPATTAIGDALNAAYSTEKAAKPTPFTVKPTRKGASPFGSERGASLVDLLNPANWAKAAGLRYAPQLAEHPSAVPGLMLDERVALQRAKQAAMKEPALERGRSMTRDMTPAEKTAMDTYLVAKNELARLQSGITKIQGGRTAAQVQAEIAQSAAALPAGKLARWEAEYRAWTDEGYNRLVAAGLLNPAHVKRADYVHHMVKAHWEYLGDAFEGAQKGVRRSPVGAAKQALGSELAIERDPYRAGAFAEFASRRALLEANLRKEIVNQHGLTDKVKAGQVTFDPEQHAVYGFGPGKPELIVGRDATNMADALIAGQQNPGPGAPFVLNGRRYDILPRDIAEGLSKVGARAELGPLIGPVLHFGARLGRVTNLLLSPAFQIAQWFDDVATGMFNVPAHKWPHYFVAVGKNARTLTKEYWKVLTKDGRSDILDALRERGLSTDTLESMINSADPTHVISGKAVARQHRPAPTLLDRFKRAEEYLNAAGQVREMSVKKAVADIWESLGAAPDAAAQWANRVTGKYHMKSVTGGVFTQNILFTKFLSEAILRLSIDMAKDPVTGNRLPRTFGQAKRGLLYGPATPIAAYAVLQHILNNRDEDTAAAARNLPANKSSAIILGVKTDADGKPVLDAEGNTVRNVFYMPGLIRLAYAMWDTLGLILSGRPGVAAKDLGDTVLARGNPAVKVPWALFRGSQEDLSGRRMEPADTRYLSTEQKKAVNAKRGGFPFLSPTQQGYLDIVTGAPGRLTKAFLSKDRPADVNRLAGLPFGTVRITDKIMEDRVRYGPEMWQRFLDDDDDAADWLFENGFTAAQLRAARTRGAKTFAELMETPAAERIDKRRARASPFRAPATAK